MDAEFWIFHGYPKCLLGNPQLTLIKIVLHHFKILNIFLKNQYSICTLYIIADRTTTLFPRPRLLYFFVTKPNLIVSEPI